MAIVVAYFRRALRLTRAPTTNPGFCKRVRSPYEWFGIFLLAALLSPVMIALSPIITLSLLIRACKDRKRQKEQEKANQAVAAVNGLGPLDEDTEYTVGPSVPLQVLVSLLPKFSE